MPEILHTACANTRTDQVRRECVCVRVFFLNRKQTRQPGPDVAACFASMLAFTQTRGSFANMHACPNLPTKCKYAMHTRSLCTYLCSRWPKIRPIEKSTVVWCFGICKVRCGDCQHMPTLFTNVVENIVNSCQQSAQFIAVI